MSSLETNSHPVSARAPGRSIAAWWQALPLTTVFVLFFLIPLALVLMVSFWDYNQYEMLPGFTFKNYVDVFDGCLSSGDMCVTFKTYLSTSSPVACRWCCLCCARFRSGPPTSSA